MSVSVNHNNRYEPPRQKRGNGPSALAWATVITGVGSWIVLPLAGAVVALICGLIERRKIAEGTSAPEGQSLVTIGLVCAAVQLSIVLLFIVAAVLFAMMFGLGLMVG